MQERAAAQAGRRRRRSKRDWMSSLLQVAERTQQALSLSEVSAEIVAAGLNLGFARLRLWLRREGQQSLELIAQSAEGHVPAMLGAKLELTEAVYVRHIHESGQPSFHRGRLQQLAVIDRIYGPQGFEPPAGEWASLPLWGSRGCIGLLVLDNGPSTVELSQVDRTMLSLFARQSAAALERALLYEQGERLSRLVQIGERLQGAYTLQAVQGELVASGYALGFARVRLWQLSHDGLWMRGVRHLGGRGLAGFDRQYRLSVAASPYAREVIGAREPCYFHGRDQGPSPLDQSFADSGFQQPHGDWVEIPLWAEGRCWGSLALDGGEHSGRIHPERRDQLRLFMQLAWAALDRAHHATAQQREALAHEVIGRAGHAVTRLVERRLADEGYRGHEDQLWYLTLAAITDRELGLGLPAATLLLANSAQTMAQAYAVSTRDRDELGSDGYSQVRRGAYSLKDYVRGLDDLTEPMPTLPAAQQLTIDLRHPQLAPLLSGETPWLTLDMVGAALGLPQRDGVLMPLRAGERTLGLLLLGVEHGGEGPALHYAGGEKLLDQIAGLLRQVALNVEMLRQHRVTQQLVRLTHRVLRDEASPLKETLKAIGLVVQEIMGADCVMIYPFRTGGKAYDPRTVVALGLRHRLQPPREPSANGITTAVLEHGFVRIEDTTQDGQRFGDWPLAEHRFLAREEIRACIGVRLHDRSSNQTYGILFIDYRTPRRFSYEDHQLAETLASLTAFTIARHQVAEDLRAGREELEVITEMMRSIMTLERRRADQRESAGPLLTAARRLLGDDPSLSIGLLLRKWHHELDSTPVQETSLRFYAEHGDGGVVERMGAALDRGITGLVLRTQQSQLVDDVRNPAWSAHFVAGPLANTRSELDVPLLYNDSDLAIGVLNIESPEVAAFSERHRYLIERFAQDAALVMGAVRRRIALDQERHRLEVALRTAEAVDVNLDERAVLRAILELLRIAFPETAFFVARYAPEERALFLMPELADFYDVGPNEVSARRRLDLDGKSIASRVARRFLEDPERRLTPSNVPSVHDDDDYIGLRQPTEAQLTAPIAGRPGADGRPELLGVIGLESSRAAAFDTRDALLLEAVSRQIGLALQRTRDLSELRRVTTLLSRTFWAAEVAHDINSEIGKIRRKVQFLLDSHELGPQGVADLRMIDHHADRLAGVVKAVQDDGPMSLEPFALRPWLTAALHDLYGDEPVRYAWAPGELQVRGHKATLYRVMRHLVRNAKAAMGGVGSLSIRTRAVGDRAEVVVGDSGPGFPPELRAKIFQEPMGGRAGGLGLLFVRQMMEEMAGSVRLGEPDEGPGGCIVLALTR